MNKILQNLIVAGLAISMVGCGGNKEKESVSSPTTSTDKTEEVKKQENTKTTETEEKKTTTSNTSKETSLDDEDDPITPKEQKAKEQGYVADKSKFPKGEYYIAKSGMHVRKRTSVESTEVYTGFPVGTVLQITSTKNGEKDPSTVWGKINSPVSGWICIADTQNCYLMTPEEWEASGMSVKEPVGNGASATVETTAEPNEDGSTSNLGTVTVQVVIQWEGQAKEHEDEIGPLELTLTDPDGPATATLSAENGWSTKFKIARGVEFVCNIDFSEYPFITEFDYKWNASTGVFTYIVS
ncbi:MAG: hypothetical protein Q4C49_14495 [Bacillota bacterium]|nr:hypothetical protein [Bacillota bacterium]